VLIVDRLLIAGIRFVMDKLLAAVEQELDDDTTLRERLLEAQLRLDSGELPGEEFAELEAEILARLRDIRERRGGAEGMAMVGEGMEIMGIEAEFAADEIHTAAMGGTPDPPKPKKKKPAKKTRAVRRSR
jgi:hypothetical protein